METNITIHEGDGPAGTWYMANRRLSLKAKAIMRSLIIFEEVGISYNRLSSICSDGEHSIRTGIQELKDNGYLNINPVKNSKGLISKWKYDVYMNPLSNPELNYKYDVAQEGQE